MPILPENRFLSARHMSWQVRSFAKRLISRLTEETPHKTTTRLWFIVCIRIFNSYYDSNLNQSSHEATDKIVSHCILFRTTQSIKTSVGREFPFNYKSQWDYLHDTNFLLFTNSLSLSQEWMDSNRFVCILCLRLYI